MKKGKKMPSIEIEGRSSKDFVLKDGRIMTVEEALSEEPSNPRREEAAAEVGSSR